MLHCCYGYYSNVAYSSYLDHHTTLDEVIKGHSATPSTIKFPYQQSIKLIRQPITKAGKS